MKAQHYFAPGTIIDCRTGKKPPYLWLLAAVAALLIVGALL